MTRPVRRPPLSCTNWSAPWPARRLVRRGRRATREAASR